jgi:T5SS/PEP-CTERM-associated repeat protein
MVLLTLLASPIRAERFFWFDTTSGTFSDPSHWAAPDGTLNPVASRNPNPRNLVPGAGDDVAFGRWPIDDVSRTGAAYQVMVPTAAVSVFEAISTPTPGTLQPLTFVVGTLTAETLNLSGKIIMKGGNVTGNGANNFLADVTFTDGATVTLNELADSSALVVEGGSSLTAQRLRNDKIGFHVRDSSSVTTDAIILRGGLRMNPSPDISGKSILKVGTFEFMDGWMRLSSGSTLEIDQVQRRDPNFSSIAILITNKGSEWILKTPIEAATVEVSDEAHADLGPDVRNSFLRAFGKGSKVEFQKFTAGIGEISSLGGGLATGSEVSLAGGRVSATDGGSVVRITKSLRITGGNGTFSADSFDGGGATNEAAFARISGNLGVFGQGAVALFDTLYLGDEPGFTVATLQEKGKLLIREGGTNWIATTAESNARTIIATGAQFDASKADEVIIGKSGTGSVLVSGNGKLLFGPALNAGPPGEGTDEAKCEPEPGPNAPETPKFVIAGEKDSKGTVSLTGPDVQAEINGERFYIGDQGGEGTLWLRDGARLKLGVILMTLGRQAGAKGILRLDGAGSTLEGIQTGRDETGAKLEIGRFGEGLAEILNGAELNLPSIILGCFTNSTGTVRVTGQAASGTSPSTFQTDGSITIGSNGEGILEITSGAKVTSYNNAVIGRFGLGEGTVTLRGEETRWMHSSAKGAASAGSVVVGMSGKGTLLVGDKARFTAGTLVIGDIPDERKRAEGMLIITNGGVVTVEGTAFVPLGRMPGSKGTLVLDGPDSSLQGIMTENQGAGATLEIGLRGEGTVILTNGGKIKLPSVVLGSLAGSSGIVKIGNKSTFESDGSITVGGVSTGRVEVAAGGILISSKDAVLARAEESKGSVLLAGSNTRWKHTQGTGNEGPGDFVIGDAGHGELTVLGGAQFEASSATLGKTAKGVGELTVSGKNAHVTLGSLALGADYNASNPSAPLGTGILTITDDGLVELPPGDKSALVEISSPAGKSSILALRAGRFIAKKTALELGGAGETQVTALDGSEIDTSSALIGTGPGRATVFLTGANGAVSVWVLEGQNRVSDRLVVGGFGEGSLEINGLAQVLLPPSLAAGGVKIGTDSKGSIKVDGKDRDAGGLGAKLDAKTAPLDIGSGAAIGELTIQGGGQVIAGAVNLNGPQGTVLVVNGKDSQLTASKAMTVAAGASATVDAAGSVTAKTTLLIRDASVSVLGEGALDVGPRPLVAERTSGGIVRVFGGVGPGGAPNGVDTLVIQRGTLNVSKTFSLRSQLGIQTVDDVPILTASFVVARLLDGAITVGAGPTAPKNSVLVNAGGLVTGIGVILGPTGTHALIYRNGGVCDLLPYSLVPIINQMIGGASSAGLSAKHLAGATAVKQTASPGVPLNISGTLFIDGDYEQLPGGSLNVVVAGPRPQVDYGVLEVSGTIKIAGKAVVRFTSGFAPQRGQSLDFLASKAAVTGNFDSVEILGLAPGFQYQIKPGAGGGLSLVALNDGVPASSPRITIRPAGAQMEVSWPAFVQDFKLQSTTGLSSESWSERTTTNNRFSFDVTQPAEFFRLIKP